jgi:hypothetical protein
MDAVKDILERLGIKSVEGMAVNESYTIEVEGYEDLTIEKIGPDRLSVAHHYIQRGDLMCDPEIVFRVKEGKWIPIRYTQHPRVHLYDPEGIEVEAFVIQWSENLREQGFVDVGKEIVE